MDDTTHPCFCSRCMVWSLVVEWYIIIFSDVNIRESKPNSGEKAVRSPSRSRQGCGMMVWQVVDGMVTLDGNAMGGCIEWSHNNKWLIPDVTKNVSWRNNFDVIWKDWGLEERNHFTVMFVVFQFRCCVFCLFIILCFFVPPTKNPRKNLSGTPLSTALNLAATSMGTGLLTLPHVSRRDMKLSHWACTCTKSPGDLKKNPKSQRFFSESSQKRVLILRDFFDDSPHHFLGWWW